MIIKDPTRVRIELEQYETKALDDVVSLLCDLKSKIEPNAEYGCIYTQDYFHDDEDSRIDESELAFVIELLDYLENRNLYLEKRDDE